MEFSSIVVARCSLVNQPLLPRVDRLQYLTAGRRGWFTRLRQVLVYNYNNLLVSKIVGFNRPIGVAMGYKCSYLLISDYGRGTYLL